MNRYTHQIAAIHKALDLTHRKFVSSEELLAQIPNRLV